MSDTVYQRYETTMHLRGRVTVGMTLPAIFREAAGLDDRSEKLIIEYQDGADFFIVRRTHKTREANTRARRMVE